MDETEHVCHVVVRLDGSLVDLWCTEHCGGSQLTKAQQHALGEYLGPAKPDPVDVWISRHCDPRLSSGLRRHLDGLVRYGLLP